MNWWLDISCNSKDGIVIKELKVEYHPTMQSKQSLLQLLANEVHVENHEFVEGQIYSITRENIQSIYDTFADSNLDKESFQLFRIPVNIIFCNIKCFLLDKHFYTLGVNDLFECSFYHRLGFDQVYIQQYKKEVFGNIFASGARSKAKDQTIDMGNVFAGSRGTLYSFLTKNSTLGFAVQKYGARSGALWYHLQQTAIFSICTNELTIRDEQSNQAFPETNIAINISYE